jgi:uncharacterized protein affecting Mg2+/Co2+ transport
MALSSTHPLHLGVLLVSRFLHRDSDTGEDVFAYRLLIENRGQNPVQVHNPAHVLSLVIATKT